MEVLAKQNDILEARFRRRLVLTVAIALALLCLGRCTLPRAFVLDTPVGLFLAFCVALARETGKLAFRKVIGAVNILASFCCVTNILPCRFLLCTRHCPVVVDPPNSSVLNSITTFITWWWK